MTEILNIQQFSTHTRARHTQCDFGLFVIPRLQWRRHGRQVTTEHISTIDRLCLNNLNRSQGTNLLTCLDDTQRGFRGTTR